MEVLKGRQILWNRRNATITEETSSNRMFNITSLRFSRTVVGSTNNESRRGVAEYSGF